MLVLLFIVVLAACHIADAFHFPQPFTAKPVSTDLRHTASKRFELSMKRSGLKGMKVSPRCDLPAMFVNLSGEDDENTIENICEDDMAYAETFLAKPPQIGDMVTGRVILINELGAYLEIPGKYPGFIPVAEGSLLPINSMDEVVKMDEVLTVEMIGTLRKRPVLSLRSARLAEAWNQVNVVKTADESFEVTVLEVNRGGAVTTGVAGLRGFLPGSHSVGGVITGEAVGTNLTVKILDAVPNEGKLVLSQRLAHIAAATLHKTGALVNATVSGIRPYGVFMEVEGGHPGLLHISQISSERLTNLEAVFTLGEKMQVAVMDHDRAQGRVALNTRWLEVNPGDMIHNRASVMATAEETLARHLARRGAERAAKEAFSEQKPTKTSASTVAVGDDEGGTGVNVLNTERVLLAKDFILQNMNLATSTSSSFSPVVAVAAGLSETVTIFPSSEGVKRSRRSPDKVKSGKPVKVRGPKAAKEARTAEEALGEITARPDSPIFTAVAAAAAAAAAAATDLDQVLVDVDGASVIDAASVKPAARKIKAVQVKEPQVNKTVKVEKVRKSRAPKDSGGDGSVGGGVSGVLPTHLEDLSDTTALKVDGTVDPLSIVVHADKTSDSDSDSSPTADLTAGKTKGKSRKKKGDDFGSKELPSAEQVSSPLSAWSEKSEVVSLVTSTSEDDDAEMMNRCTTPGVPALAATTTIEVTAEASAITDTPLVEKKVRKSRKKAVEVDDELSTAH